MPKDHPFSLASSYVVHIVATATMPYPPLAVANYFIGRAQKDGRTLTPLQLLKLVYIAHGVHLGAFKQPLISEGVEAWMYGPVIPSLYHEFKKYGSGSIKEMATVFQNGQQLVPIVSADTDSAAVDLLDVVWESYGSMSGLQLSTLSHEQGSPWSETWDRCGGKKYTPIPNDLIQDFYAQQLNVT